jgi:hypothetical protein
MPPEQYSDRFLQGMLNRMAQGYHKYGSAEKNLEADWIPTMQLRIEKYIETGNTEWLMDAANYLMCEFMYPRHEEGHFRATESNESPGYVDMSGNVRVTTRQKPPSFHEHGGD